MERFAFPRLGKLPVSEVASADVVETVRASGAAPVVKLAFEFLVLTAARSGEVRGAEWTEIDTEEHIWTVPATRTKAKREHRVPLSGPALADRGRHRQGRAAAPALPGRARRAVPVLPHKLPVALDGWRATFVFVQDVDETESAVRTWGSQHAALWAALIAGGRAVEVVVVGRDPEPGLRPESHRPSHPPRP